MKAMKLNHKRAASVRKQPSVPAPLLELYGNFPRYRLMELLWELWKLPGPSGTPEALIGWIKGEQERAKALRRLQRVEAETARLEAERAKLIENLNLQPNKESSGEPQSE